MSSHLHPRSRLTSSLFATTLFASIIVVVLPHVLPCPAPRRVAFTDDGGDGSRIQVPSANHIRQEGVINSEMKGSITEKMKEGTQNLYTNSNLNRRECPIPKPRGFFGDLLGFKSSVSVGSGDNGDKSANSYNKEKFFSFLDQENIQHIYLHHNFGSYANCITYLPTLKRTRLNGL